MSDLNVSGRFTKRPVTIDAWRIDLDSAQPDWVRTAFGHDVIDWSPDGEGLYINTLEGLMTGSIGDWLIRGVKGELYACKPEIFEATYSPADQAAQPAQAGQVLTHREVLEAWTNTTLEPCTHQEAFVRGARWAEQSVLARVARVPQWLPIETAPKDGSVVDLWHSEFGRMPGWYWGLPHHCCGEMGSYCDSDWHSLEPGWVDEFNEPHSVDADVTHWMPLPAAPQPRGPAQ